LFFDLQAANSNRFSKFDAIAIKIDKIMILRFLGEKQIQFQIVIFKIKKNQ